MFGELSVMAWLGAAIMLAIGGGAGFFVARQIKDKRTLELEQQLEATQSKLNDYQEDVNRHFLKTSLLFSKLTDNYRDVYEHLATGAQKLCNDKPLISALDLPEANILSAGTATHASAALGTNEQTETDATTPAPEHPAPEQIAPDDATHLGAEATVDTEAISTSNSEAAPTEKTALPEHTAAEHSATQAATEQSPAASEPTETTKPANAEPVIVEKSATAQNTDDTPTISEEELKALEASEKEKDHGEDVHLGAESTPGVELEYHKTHPSIH